MITPQDVLETAPHRFCAEASELRLPPGGWPAELTTSLGNRLPFLRTAKKIDADGDVQYVRYVQLHGCLTLIVYND